MNELLEKDQEISIVPQDFKNSNKGKVVEIQDKKFLLEVFHAPVGIIQNRVMEFYSQTKNGMLFFTSSILNINDNILTIAIPKKHRFLQRRAFTRINFSRPVECKLENKSYQIKPMDLSVGGMKFKTAEHFDIDAEYDLNIELLKEESIKCKIQLIRIEKNDGETYTLSGRFKDLANVDKMTLTQFCMRRNIENKNK